MGQRQKPSRSLEGPRPQNNMADADVHARATTALGLGLFINTVPSHQVLGEIAPVAGPLWCPQARDREGSLWVDVWSLFFYLSAGCHAIVSWNFCEESMKRDEVKILGTKPRTGPAWVLKKVRACCCFCSAFLRVPVPDGWWVPRLADSSRKRWPAPALLPPLQPRGALAAYFLVRGSGARLRAPLSISGRVPDLPSRRSSFLF